MKYLPLLILLTSCGYMPLAIDIAEDVADDIAKDEFNYDLDLKNILENKRH